MSSTSLANGTTVLDEIYDEVLTGRFYPAMHRLSEMLTLLRSEMHAKEWSEFCEFAISRHPLRELLRQGPITGQWLQSPPEWSTDSLAIDLVCGRTGIAEKATDLEKLLYGREYGFLFSQTLRSRRSLIALELNGIAKEQRSATILSLGHSHIAETPLSQVRRFSGDLAPDGGKERFDFIYALDFFDTLDSVAATNALPALMRMLKPNGRLLAANLASELPEAAYLEAFMDYWPNYRSEQEMAKLAIEVPEREVSSQCVFRDDVGYTIFLEIQRSAEPARVDTTDRQ